MPPERPPVIDCDIHPRMPGVRALVPYLDPFWAETLPDRGLESLDTVSYPPNAPLTCRPDWRDPRGRPGGNLAGVREHVLGRWQADTAICNCLCGVQLVFNEDMATALAKAVNDWLAAEWLDREPALRASVVVAPQSVEGAVAEIERRAQDRRFVAVLLLAMGEAPLGRRRYWPVYEAAARHGLPIMIHAGSSYNHPVTALGWPTYCFEDYASQPQGFQAQVASLVCEGVFEKYPELRVVLAESGVSWLPGVLWRLSKMWRGVRSEVPWLDRSPAEVVRDHFRLTVQPLDAPPEMVEGVIDHLQSDQMLLYSSDYPHWQFDEDEVMPKGIPDGLHPRVMTDNPLATFSRLAESAP